ncbi:MAG TPA: DUF5995 family protein [Mycobacterium sp.]
MPPPLPSVDTLDDVVDALQAIIDWSIEAQSRLGYFAVMYKRTTFAIRGAIDQGAFEDGPRATRFGLAFANRYFDAVRSHFYGGHEPAQVWQIAFEANAMDELIILQHMLTGMNAHVAFDLGVAAAVIGGPALESLRNDFDAVNAILVSQIDVIANAIEQVSPGFAHHRKLLTDNDVGSIGALLRQSREFAWAFAQQLVVEPESRRPKVIDDHDTIFAWWGRRYSNPPPPLEKVIDAIGETESRDTSHNIRVLDRFVSRPP